MLLTLNFAQWALFRKLLSPAEPPIALNNQAETVRKAG
ncbi:hypothetical protein KIS4809_0768 [Bacillus sp. ZZV12-4809]|nr:hypothetical protein KIS4809_0768 [Bacillus sp. ZZV12-4809]